MACSLVAQASPGDLAQLLLNERNDSPERCLVTRPPRQQERRYVGALVRNSRDSTPETGR
jgi:hypothetical protein